MHEPTRPALWTVGHSNHELARFLDLLGGEGIEAVIDVRSYPYSRYAPHFNREELQQSLAGAGLGYYFQGEALGGRPSSEEHYDREGHALYGPMSEQPAFRAAIERIVSGSRSHRLALLCSEGFPGECHRRLLVGRVLCRHGVELRHIFPDGHLEVETEVSLSPSGEQAFLFDQGEPPWRSTQSVSRRRRLSTSSAA
jgi:uncharacterized protein (DUF488 family)